MLGDEEFDIRDEGVEEGMRRWQISQVRVYKEEAIGQSEKRWGIELEVFGHQGQKEE